MEGIVMKAIKVTTDNVITIIDLTESDDQPLYKALQREVGGYVENVNLIGLPHPYCMLVDEEGLLKGKRSNFLGGFLISKGANWRRIVGDIVIMRLEGQEDGIAHVGLSDNEIENITNALGAIIALCKSHGIIGHGYRDCPSCGFPGRPVYEHVPGRVHCLRCAKCSHSVWSDRDEGDIYAMWDSEVQRKRDVQWATKMTSMG
jgi:hypothetical protein